MVFGSGVSDFLQAEINATAKINNKIVFFMFIKFCFK
jgi:hypothetical protein